ncbi:terminase large subunit [Mycobacterium phage Phlei]|uniref:Terminase n=1 Tax=Mycobacterium phage Phlei TaxID=1690684 RepID=A0A0N9BDP6_9CAUD|nr:terminase large subunit [Mycobacterium phage Phlei]ALA48121.1 hypothetical protein [Mycobacterium phage Phlei]
MGPSWQKTVDGDWYLPDKTLGWGVIEWIYKYVNTPGGHDSPHRLEFLIKLAECGLLVNEEMIVFTDEQIRLILWWYAVDEHGNYVYREGVIRRLKGWGKDPFIAALCLAELCGPVAFSHFDENGDPVGKRRPAPWVTVAAVSQDQTKNTFSLFPAMISKQLKTDYGLEVNRFVIYSDGGAGRLEAATASPTSMEGNRPTFVVQNEIQWWGQGPDGKVNEGRDMANMIEGNMTKVEGARTLSICNAHIPGTDTTGEVLYDQYHEALAGKSYDAGLMYDALEAPADTPVSEIPSPAVDEEGFKAGVEKLKEGVTIARGDSTWLPVDDIVKSILSPKNPVTESRRKFLNQINAAEDSWITPQQWDRLAMTDPVFKLQPKQKITLGFDGSKSNDWTALVACRVDDGMLFVLGVWNPENYGGEVPREDVDAAVRSAFQRYDVVAMRADVKEFEAYVDQWGKDFKRRVKVNASPGNPIAFDMRGQQKRFALDCERFEDAVIEREVFHDGNKILRSHVLNAKRHPTNYDAIAIRKATKDSSKKIDAAVCAVLAFGARQDYLMSKKARTGRVVAVR